MAIEFFIRNCLIEVGQPEDQVTALDFAGLIGAGRKHLGWQVPKHYTTKETTRLLRNAVIHGGALPTADNAQFRLLFDKWRLFLFRRVLIRLGYAGKGVSEEPQGVPEDGGHRAAGATRGVSPTDR